MSWYNSYPDFFLARDSRDRLWSHKAYIIDKEEVKKINFVPQEDAKTLIGLVYIKDPHLGQSLFKGTSQ